MTATTDERLSIAFAHASVITAKLAAALPSTADRNRLRELALSTVRHGGWTGPVEAVVVYEAGRLIVQARPALTPQQPESPAAPQTEAVDGIKQWARDRVAKGR